MAIDDLVKADKEKRAIFGADRTLKALRNGEVHEIFISSDCPANIVKLIESLTKLSELVLTKLKENSEEFSILVKKPFSIAVASIKKKKG